MVNAGSALATGLELRFGDATVVLGCTLGSLIKVSVGHARQSACTDFAGPAKTTICELNGVTD